MALFAEQGFAVTTVPQIAERAGLTTRSFFRWYPDKREVLFSGEDELPEIVTRVFADAPAHLEPLEVVRYGFRVVLDDHLTKLRPDFVARWRIIQTDEGLQERQSRKLALLREGARRGFLDRGLGRPDAELAARIAVSVYDAVVERWLSNEGRTFAEVGDEVIDSLHELLEGAARTAGR